MIRNRNGYWMSPAWFNLFPDDGAGTNGGDPAGDGTDATGGENGADGAGDGDEGENKAGDLNAEIERLKADLQKQKEALNKATKEAGDLRKTLRSKQTAEEVAAEEKKAAEEKAAQELEELRKEVAKAKTVKSVMSKLGTDEDVSGKISDCLYGAEDIENAMLLIQKAWAAREKALRLEFGKIPGPGAGSADGEDSAERKAIELAKKIGRERADANKAVAAGLNGYIR